MHIPGKWWNKGPLCWSYWLYLLLKKANFTFGIQELNARDMIEVRKNKKNHRFDNILFIIGLCLLIY